MAVRAVVLVGALVGLVACSTAPPSGPTPTGGAPRPSTGSAVSPPGSAPSPSATATPPPTAAPSPFLGVDHVALVAEPDGLTMWDVLHVRRGPEVTRLGRVDAGDMVFLWEGPRELRGTTWWHVRPIGTPDDVPTAGWVMTNSRGSSAALTPHRPDCPPLPEVTTSELARMDGLVRLSCFGDQPITLEGDLTCHEGVIDAEIGGAWWMDWQYWCDLDGFPVHGSEGRIGETPGSPRPYRIVGHFDDEAAQGCHTIAFGTSADEPYLPAEPEAVIVCRQAFVMAGAEPLEAATASPSDG